MRTVKKPMVVIAAVLALAAPVFAAGQDKLISELVDQLNGGPCRYELNDGRPVKRGWFASSVRRSDKEYCIIDAAKALGSLGAEARLAVPALIEALKRRRNVDSGDGIVPVRSEIALALGRIRDQSAIPALMEVLDSDDETKLSSTGAFPPGYRPSHGTSLGAVRDALRMIEGSST